MTNITGGGAGSSRAELSNYLIHGHINRELALFKPASSLEIKTDSNLCYCVLNLHFSCFTSSNPPLRDAGNSDNDVRAKCNFNGLYRLKNKGSDLLCQTKRRSCVAEGAEALIRFIY